MTSLSNPNPEIMVQLRYISTEEPGYTRKKWGRGFTYRDTQGKTIRDPDLRAWIEAIVIPPAWTDVWISPYKDGHILATGRDDKGRKQYCYHPAWQELRNQKKFNRLYDFGQSLPLIRRTTDEHLRQRTVSRKRVLAAIIRLLEGTLIRIGSEQYARENESYGLSTLTDDHVDVEGSKITFDFAGKSGKEHTIVFRDQRLARIVKRCQDLPGYELFQYHDENGEHQVVDSADVNAYLQAITGKAFTAKVFRTWGGSTLAIKHLCERCRDRDDRDDAIRDTIAHVAELLGNTVAVTRDYYIHPRILAAYRDSTLCAGYTASSAQESDHALTPEEQTLVNLIGPSD